MSRSHSFTLNMTSYALLRSFLIQTVQSFEFYVHNKQLFYIYLTRAAFLRCEKLRFCHILVDFCKLILIFFDQASKNVCVFPL